MTAVPGSERPWTIDPWRDDRTAMASGCGLIVLLTTAFYFPALVLHRTLVYGDITAIDWPLFDFFARVIKGQASPLWSTQTWGGHPLFAEGQGGFAHPLNILWAAIVTPAVGPIYSMNLFYWLLMTLGGAGVMGLCRTLGASFWAASFAALAVIFSPIWSHMHNALPLFHTVTWIPWALWAMEAWLKRPTIRSAALFGSAGALVILSGYPQGLHGTIIFALATFLIAPFQTSIRAEWVKSGGRRAMLLLLACAICVGLSFVQLLPLLELVGLSHRSAGIALAFAGKTSLPDYLRALLVTEEFRDGIGSLFICILASIALFLSIPDRVKGYVLAALVLMILGWERATPIFSVLYDHNLVPGLSYFRVTGIYIAIGSIGVAVAAAFAIDRLSEWDFPSSRTAPNGRARASFATYAGYALLAALWISALSSLRFTGTLGIHIAVAVGAAAAGVYFVKQRKQYLIAPVLTLFLTIEVLSLRLHPFDFYPDTVFAKPPAVAAIEAIPDWREYKIMAVGLTRLTAFFPPREPEYIFRIRLAIATISPMTNWLWHLPSMDSALALDLRRRKAIEQILQDEIFGNVPGQPGLRLIDLLGIRFVTNGGELATAGFRALSLDQRRETYKMVLYDNEAALPRFQTYSRYQTVGSLEEAVSAIKSLKMRQLVIEDPNRIVSPPQPSDSAVDAENAAKFDVLEATDTEYRLKVSTTKPEWLFLADANYPGWTATLDGENVPVFSAQVLGKAIEIPPGDHDVALQFRSMTFYIGLVISLFTSIIVVFGAAFVLIKVPRRPKITS